MRDQYDAEMWNAHHDQFSKWLDAAFSGVGKALRRRLGNLPEAAPQLMAATAALSLTLLTFTLSGV